MDGAHPIGLPGKTQSQDGHAERLLLGMRPGTTQLEQILEADMAIADVLGEILLHQLGGEGIVARRDRGMGGEKAARRHRLQGLDKRKFLTGNEHPDSFQSEEGSVPLVHVKDGRPEAQGIERFHPADPQDDLLPHAHVMVAAVKLVGDVSVVGTV